MTGSTGERVFARYEPPADAGSAHAPRSSPYRGLAPYGPEDRDYYFGRDTARRRIVANLFAAPVTVLYGPSGVGKTSLLGAGVVPDLAELRPPGRAKSSDAGCPAVLFRDWQTADYEERLADAIERALEGRLAPESDDAAWAPVAESRLATLLHAASERARRPLCLLLDQFEEFWYYHGGARMTDDARAFIAALASAVNRPGTRLRLLFAVREDALSVLEQIQGSIPSLLGNTLRLEHLARDEAVEAIRRPLERYHERHPDERAPSRIEDELLEAVLSDRVRFDPGGRGATAERAAPATGASPEGDARIETPFLQLVLERLWEAERADGSGVMRLETFRRLGRASGIVRGHFESAMRTLGVGERNAMARAFRFLVTPSGTKVAHTAATLAAFASVSRPAVLTSALQKLQRARILRTIDAPSGLASERSYEIYHDTLAPAVLELARRHAEKRRLQRATGVVALVAASVFGVYAWTVRTRNVEHERADRRATSRETAARAAALLTTEPARALGLAVQAVQDASPDDIPPQTVEVLRASLADQRLLSLVSAHRDTVRAIALSPDGRMLASVGLDGMLRLWNTKPDGAGLEPRGARSLGAQGFAVAFWPRGDSIVTGDRDGALRLWSASDTGSRAIGSHHESVFAIAVDPMGRFVASASRDNTASLWERASDGSFRRRRVFTAPSAEMTAIALSPDGATAAFGDIEGSVYLADTRSGTTRLLGRHGGRVYAAAFDPAGARLVTSSRDQTARVWDLARCAAIGAASISAPDRCSTALRGHADWVYGAAFSPDSAGRWIVTSGRDDLLCIWDLATATTVATLRGHGSFVYDARYSKDGRFIYSAGADARIGVWDARLKDVRVLRAPTLAATQAGDTIARPGTSTAPPASSSLDARGGRAANGDRVASGDAIVRGAGLVLVTASGSRRLIGSAAATSAIYTADGKWIVAVDGDGAASVWPADLSAPARTMRPDLEAVWRAQTTDDGRWVLTPGERRSVIVAPCRVCGTAAELVATAKRRIAALGAKR